MAIATYRGKFICDPNTSDVEFRDLESKLEASYRGTQTYGRIPIVARGTTLSSLTIGGGIGRGSF